MCLAESNSSSGFGELSLGTSPQLRGRGAGCDMTHTLGEGTCACGGELPGTSHTKSPSGRSPRVQGREPPRSQVTASRRKIPARAGASSAARCGCGGPREDPRACGGETRPSQTVPCLAGRSPRVRGRVAAAGVGVFVVCPPAFGGEIKTLQDRVSAGGRSPRVRGRGWRRTCCPPRPRKIPARTGARFKLLNRMPELQEDPRACGGKIPSAISARPSRGRSPRVRGQGAPSGGSPTRCRKIPARAGARRRRPLDGPEAEEDPRACGGKGRIVLAPARWRRKTPARAGARRRAARRRHGPGEDPRACGGKSLTGATLRAAPGRSPRVRGQGDSVGAGSGPSGKIPARAGARPTAGDDHDRPREDPRACGGKLAAGAIRVTVAGRSPRVRGQGQRSGRVALPGRKIPARAGARTQATPSGQCPREDPRACGGKAF